jgi:ParB-like chromosome segregation protein Spo0J
LTGFRPQSQFEIQMRPDDFLRAVGPTSRWHLEEKSIQELMARMEADQEIDPLFLDVNARDGRVVKHEGRHRAVAAERLGIETVPVLVYM